MKCGCSVLNKYVVFFLVVRHHALGQSSIKEDSIKETLDKNEYYYLTGS